MEGRRRGSRRRKGNIWRSQSNMEPYRGKGRTGRKISVGETELEG